MNQLRLVTALALLRKEAAGSREKMIGKLLKTFLARGGSPKQLRTLLPKGVQLPRGSSPLEQAMLMEQAGADVEGYLLRVLKSEAAPAVSPRNVGAALSRAEDIKGAPLVLAPPSAVPLVNRTTVMKPHAAKPTIVPEPLGRVSGSEVTTPLVPSQAPTVAAGTMTPNLGGGKIKAPTQASVPAAQAALTTPVRKKLPTRGPSRALYPTAKDYVEVRKRLDGLKDFVAARIRGEPIPPVAKPVVPVAKPVVPGLPLTPRPEPSRFDFNWAWAKRRAAMPPPPPPPPPLPPPPPTPPLPWMQRIRNNPLEQRLQRLSRPAKGGLITATAGGGLLGGYTYGSRAKGPQELANRLSPGTPGSPAAASQLEAIAARAKARLADNQSAPAALPVFAGLTRNELIAAGVLLGVPALALGSMAIAPQVRELMTRKKKRRRPAMAMQAEAADLSAMPQPMDPVLAKRKRDMRTFFGSSGAITPLAPIDIPAPMRLE